jgi:hypothetical protein
MFPPLRNLVNVSMHHVLSLRNVTMKICESWKTPHLGGKVLACKSGIFFKGMMGKCVAPGNVKMLDC